MQREILEKNFQLESDALAFSLGRKRDVRRGAGEGNGNFSQFIFSQAHKLQSRADGEVFSPQQEEVNFVFFFVRVFRDEKRF